MKASHPLGVAAPRPATEDREIRGGLARLRERRQSTLAREGVAPVVLVILITGLGALVRLTFALIAGGFPINDGGMFSVMVEEINLTGLPPSFTSYNGGEIPFAYPPLAFYAASAAGQLSGLSTNDVLIHMPLAFSILSVPAFYLVANALLPSQRAALVATLVFATIPAGFSWLIAGGGLTRAPGFFFALLTIWQGSLLAQDGKRHRIAATAVLGSLTLLTHLEMGWFAAFSVVLVFAFAARSARGLSHAAAVCGLGALLIAPWWLTLTARHTLAPLLNVLSAGDHSPLLQAQLLTLDFSEDAFFPVAIGLALLGLMASFRDRRYLLPAWLLIVFLLDPRKAATVSSVPLALLAGYGIAQMVFPALQTLGKGSARFPLAPKLIGGLILFVYAPLAAFGSALSDTSPLHSLSEGNRAAMAWAAGNTPQDSRFIVMPSTRSWAIDATSEWFPALTGRESLATVQGREWLPDYAERVDAYAALADCGAAAAACIEAWAVGVDFSYVYIAKGRAPLGGFSSLGEKLDCCAPLRASLVSSRGYRLIFENEGAVIFERIR